MPPKEKGSKKKTAGVEVNGVNTGDMTREQLEVFCLRMKEELDMERAERNLFQVERDKTKICWELTSNQLDDTRAEIVMREREITHGGDENDEERNKYHQEIKYIEYEHERRVKELTETVGQSLKQAQEKYLKRECEMLQAKGKLKKNLVEEAQTIREARKQVRSEVDEDIERAYDEFEKLKMDSEKNLTKLYEQLRMEVMNAQRLEMSVIVERKCEHIEHLNTDHQYYLEQFYELYDQLTMNNFVLIDSLKELIEKLLKERKQTIRKIAKYKEKNKNLIEPLILQRKETLKLQTQYKYYVRDRFMVNILSKTLDETERTCVDGMGECQVFQQYLNDLQQERDALREYIRHGKRNFQRKLDQQDGVLEKKITAWRKRLRRTDAFLRNQMLTKQIKPGLFRSMERKVQRKESLAREEHGERVRLAKMFDNTIRVHEWKARALGIPANELNYHVFQLCKLSP